MREKETARNVKRSDLRELAIWLALFSISLAARLAWLRDMSTTPFYENPVVDEYIYNQMATAILQGLPEQNGIFRPPLYPLFLSLCYSVLGVSVPAARIVQAVLGALFTIFLFHFASRFLDRRTGFLSALVYALYWPAIYFQGELLDIAIFPMLLLLSVYFFLRAIETKSGMHAGLAGLFLGLAALARGTALFFLPAMCFFLFSSLGARKGAQLLALLAVATCSLLLLSGYRNARLSGEFIMLSSNGAINFYIGNNPGADGLNSIPPGLEWNKVIKEPVRLGLVTHGEQSHYWLARSLQYIASNPGRSLLLYLKKFYAFWNAVEVSNNKDIYFMRSRSAFLSLPLPGFGLVCPFAILSLLFIKRRTPVLILLWFLVLSYALGNSLFFTTARYRMAVLPLLIVLASHAGLHLLAVARRGDLRLLARSLVLLVIALFFVNTDPLHLRAAVRTRPDFQVGQILLTLGRYEDALNEMRKDLARNPDDPDILNNIAVAYRRLGDPETARTYYERALAVGEYGGVRWNLGLLAFDEGEYEAARSEWRKALEEDPLNPAIRQNLRKVEELLR
jgi:4-amino-4-deoxy-L-arabinose transferase-like glycosyltransferase